ncbi:phosphatase PAP2 family protein [Mesobacillus harenae]|uniref:phosphatase PAP2 family protein n=1 Tax=Mesobacillus harenae TaxID=2213203 RepID=UPI001580CE3C|nr:phosphatase PAP2 family protein [Mesobacillus harenae]
METNKEKMKKAAFPVLLVLTGLVTSMFFVYLFAEIAEEMLEQELKTFDDAVIGFFRAIESSTLNQAMIFITELGSVWFLATLSIITILTLWIKVKDKWGILFFIIGIGGGGLLTRLLKYYYGRGRPSINPEIDAIGYSFPSGHSLGSLIFYGFITYFIIRSELKKSIKWVAACLAGLLVVLIGMSRIYLGAHFPSDVIAGHLAGAIWMILSILALEWVQWQTANSIRPLKTIREFFQHKF